MGKSQETFSKKEKEKKRKKKREEKRLKMEERKANGGKTSFEDMITYVDENGNFTDTPPDPTKKKKINPKSIDINIPKRVEIDDTVKTGVVDYFNTEKGFGFIIEQTTKNKYFYHINGCLEEVKEGNRVCFELEQGMKGINAVKVKKEVAKPVVKEEEKTEEPSAIEEETKEEE